ncbi:P2X purinoceptor 4-like isoform X2 [Lineus longissimus]|uniref:P2X purinoceptor 4-like isoform X2 n=1 Tax=Lineus longissimus TaxID=88925 RepID=UPI002B4FACC1
MACGRCCRWFKGTIEDFLFEYDTPMMVTIKSKKVGISNFIFQATIALYVIGYSIIYRQGYQSTGNLISSATAKIKGVAFTNATDIPDIGARIWDNVDYVVPPQESNSFFVTTNAIITDNQTQGKCPEAPDVRDSWCKTDDDCGPESPVLYGHGVRTGKCVMSTLKPIRKVCEIYAWCPVENDVLPPRLYKLPLIDATNFTVLIKNNIMFPKYNVKRRNILTKDKKYLRSCQYDPKTDRYCPIFRLGKIVELAGSNITVMGIKGGTIGIRIFWECDLDYGENACKPHYQFMRLDNKHSLLGKGWNFRYGDYYSDGGVKKRTLVKAYGIRFVILVEGQGGKFDIVELLLNLGSGIGLLAIASVISEFIVLHILKERKHYQQKKFLPVEEEEALTASLKDDDEITHYDALKD